MTDTKHENRNRALKHVYARASVSIAFAMALNVLIVSTLIAKLFGADYTAQDARLHEYVERWNILNLCRMTLVGVAGVYLFAAFRALDRVR